MGRVAICVLVLVLDAGCRNQCNESWCDDNTLRTCFDNEEGTGESERDCGAKFCVETGGGGALCAVDAAKRPACAQANFRGHACDALELLECESGYVARVLDTCASEDLCEPQITHCLLHPGTEPRCEGRTAYCDGSLRVECEIGFAIDAPIDCAPNACVEMAITAACGP